jgi:hypothetical protein
MKLTNAMRSAFVRSAMDDVPKIDYEERIVALMTDTAVGLLPAPLKKIWIERPELRDYFRKEYMSVPCGSSYCSAWVPSISTHEAEIESAAVDLSNLADKQNEQRTALRKKLEACAASVSTRKALAALLPEFEKYLPQDDTAACRTLPAVANVVADFVKAGWPKERQAAS